jgi:hypothetical protein
MTRVSRHAAIGAGAALVVAAALAGGLVLTGSPAEARLERLDARRIGDLQRISRLVDAYWRGHGRLPGSLGEIGPEPGAAGRDPVTGQPYEFRATGETRYELCAIFARRSAAERSEVEPEFWAHGEGRTCFPMEVRRIAFARSAH